MKQRPRQIDCTKPLLMVANLEAFNNAEGQEAETKSSDKIITPDILMKEKPKQFEEPILKAQLPYKCREDYIIYKPPVYPDGAYYELTEEDIHFLTTINEKLVNPVTIEDFEQFLSLLDAKSGKDVEIDFHEFQKLKLSLPKSITLQSQTLQEQLHSYFKKQRVQSARPLTRSLMHPYYEDNNPHLAFRPRTQPSERTMKLRRGNAQNQRGLNEMENVGQKIVALKRDFLLISSLIDQCVQREKAQELERRYSFCKFIKEFYDHSKKDKDSNQDLKLWSKECFVRECQEKCSINAQERGDEMFDSLSKEIVQWKELNEMLRKDRIKKEENISRFEKMLSDLIQDKLTLQEPVVVQQPIVPPQVQQQIIAPIPPIPTDDRMESVAKFFATLYLEARKFQLTFDDVLSNQFPICKQVNQSKPINQKTIFPFKLMQIEGNDLVYKSEFETEQDQKDRYYWENYSDPSLSSTLYYQYDYFRDKVNDIMEIADMDQMIYNQGQEDDKHDDEEQKIWRKKVKVSQTRSSGANGSTIK